MKSLLSILFIVMTISLPTFAESLDNAFYILEEESNKINQSSQNIDNVQKTVYSNYTPKFEPATTNDFNINYNQNEIESYTGSQVSQPQYTVPAVDFDSFTSNTKLDTPEQIRARVEAIKREQQQAPQKQRLWEQQNGVMPNGIQPTPENNLKNGSLKLQQCYNQATQYCNDFYFNTEFQRFRCIENHVFDNCSNCNYKFTKIIQNCRNSTVNNEAFENCVGQIINKHARVQLNNTIQENTETSTDKKNIKFIGISFMFTLLFIMCIILVKLILTQGRNK